MIEIDRDSIGWLVMIGESSATVNTRKKGRLTEGGLRVIEVQIKADAESLPPLSEFYFAIAKGIRIESYKGGSTAIRLGP